MTQHKGSLQYQQEARRHRAAAKDLESQLTMIDERLAALARAAASKSEYRIAKLRDRIRVAANFVTTRTRELEIAVLAAAKAEERLALAKQRSTLLGSVEVEKQEHALEELKGKVLLREHLLEEARVGLAAKESNLALLLSKEETEATAQQIALNARKQNVQQKIARLLEWARQAEEWGKEEAFNEELWRKDDSAKAGYGMAPWLPNRIPENLLEEDDDDHAK